MVRILPQQVFAFSKLPLSCSISGVFCPRHGIVSGCRKGLAQPVPGVHMWTPTVPLIDGRCAMASRDLGDLRLLPVELARAAPALPIHAEVVLRDHFFALARAWNLAES